MKNSPDSFIKKNKHSALSLLYLLLLIAISYTSFQPVFYSLYYGEVEKDSHALISVPSPSSVFYKEYVKREDHERPMPRYYKVVGKFVSFPLSRSEIHLYTDDCPIYVMINGKKAPIQNLPQQPFCNLYEPLMIIDTTPLSHFGENTFELVYTDINWAHAHDIRFGASPMRLLFEVSLYLFVSFLFIRSVSKWLLTEEKPLKNKRKRK